MSTFYIPEGPTVSTLPLDLSLTPVEQLLQQVMATETMQQMKVEIGAVGDGLLWHKDHFEMIQARSARNCATLMNHHMYI